VLEYEVHTLIVPLPSHRREARPVIVLQGGYEGRWGGDERPVHKFRFRLGVIDGPTNTRGPRWMRNDAWVTHQWPLDLGPASWSWPIQDEPTIAHHATIRYSALKAIETRWIDTITIAAAIPLTTFAEAALCLWPNAGLKTALEDICQRFSREIDVSPYKLNPFLTGVIVQRFLPIVPLAGVAADVL